MNYVNWELIYLHMLFFASDSLFYNSNKVLLQNTVCIVEKREVFIYWGFVFYLFIIKKYLLDILATFLKKFLKWSC